MSTFDFQAHQFPPLRNLKLIDFSECELETVDSKTFQVINFNFKTRRKVGFRFSVESYLFLSGFVSCGLKLCCCDHISGSFH